MSDRLKLGPQSNKMRYKRLKIQVQSEFLLHQIEQMVAVKYVNTINCFYGKELFIAQPRPVQG